MKRLLKKLRSFLLFNIPIRSFIRSFVSFSNRVNRFFSLHWPVYGTISFHLPAGERVKIYSKGDDFVSTQAYWKGYMGYEGPTIQLFYNIAKCTSTIIDVGSNVGYFSLIGAAANKQAHVHSFEPVVKIHKRLLRNISINGFINIKANQCAVGNVDEIISFFIPEGNGMVHASSTKEGWGEKAIRVNVESITIDKYVKENSLKKVDLVKMDVEFHESEVLEGMKNVLENDKPIIISEVLFSESEGVKGHFENDIHLKIASSLRAHGYYFYLINATALIRVEQLEYNPDDRNYLFSTKRSENIYLPYSNMNELLRNIL